MKKLVITRKICNHEIKIIMLYMDKIHKIPPEFASYVYFDKKILLY